MYRHYFSVDNYKYCDLYLHVYYIGEADFLRRLLKDNDIKKDILL